MEDFIVIDGDSVQFTPAFGPAIVIVQPGKITAGQVFPPASDAFVIQGRRPCREGDEKSVSLPGCSYMTPQYSIPGTGTLKIERLNADQIATNTRIGGKRVLLKGSTFIAKFEVQSPAKQPPAGPGAPIPDATPQYLGQGRFVTTNASKKGS
jgi:contractile injection system spike tip protein